MGLISDARNIKARDPAARGVLSVILLYPGFHALVYYRVSHFFYKIRLFFLARMISQSGRFFTGIEIHPGAKIGKGLFIDHGMGVVIGETAEIGDNCTIYHGCTLGGTGKDKGKRHPTLGNNVLVGAGAKILGPFKVGDNALIGANAVVLNEVPAGSTVVGVPGRAIKKDAADTKISSVELDQTHTPDPVAIELCMVLHRIKRIEHELSIDNKVPFDSQSVLNNVTPGLKNICSEDLIQNLEKKNQSNNIDQGKNS